MSKERRPFKHSLEFRPSRAQVTKQVESDVTLKQKSCQTTFYHIRCTLLPLLVARKKEKEVGNYEVIKSTSSPGKLG